MKADLARREPEMLAWWEEQRHLRQAARGRARPSDVRAARRSAVRERRDPHRPRRQQGAEGHHRQVAHARRLRLAVRAGLGLPRPADRAPGREEARPRRRKKLDAQGVPPGLPRIRAGAGRRAAQRFQAPRRASATGTIRTSRMAPRYEAEQLRAFAQIIRNGHLYKGYKPVHWCLDCRSALAEAEVEYEDETSPAIDVRFDVVDRAELRAALRRRTTLPDAAAPASRSGPRRPGRCRRTRPCRLAPGVSTTCCSECRATAQSRGAGRSPTSCSMPCLARYGARARARCSAQFAGTALERLQLEHPFYERTCR